MAVLREGPSAIFRPSNDLIEIAHLDRPRHAGAGAKDRRRPLQIAEFKTPELQFMPYESSSIPELQVCELMLLARGIHRDSRSVFACWSDMLVRFFLFCWMGLPTATQAYISGRRYMYYALIYEDLNPSNLSTGTPF